MSEISGSTVSSAFSFAGKFGEEIDAMSSRLSELLREAIDKDRPGGLVSAPDTSGYDDWPSRDGTGGWISTDSAFNLPLKPKGKGRHSVDSYTGFQVSISGDGARIPGTEEEPLIHMFCWDGSLNFDDYYLGFPLGDPDEYPFVVEDGKAVIWTYKEERPQTRNYSLRLLKLANEADLQKYCVAPTLALLNGKSVADALPDEFLRDRILVKLPERDKLCSDE